MLAAAVVLSVVVISAAPVALAAGPSVSLILTPSPGSIAAGESQDYHALAYQANGLEANGTDVTGYTKFTIDPDGSCTPGTTPDTETCTATTAGPHTVTGTITYQVGSTTGTATGTATLDVQPGPLDNLKLTPNPGSVTAGQTITYHADGQDAYGNSRGDLTGSTTFTIADGTCTAGTCTPAPDGSCIPDTTTPGTEICTATGAGPHTVTGTYNPVVGISASDTTGGTAAPGGAITGTAALDVRPGPTAGLTLTPGSATIEAGGTQGYQAEGKDAYGNPLGDLTRYTTFTITPDGSCPPEGKTCTATTAGPHTVTGTVDLGHGVTARGSATLDVQPGPPASLALHPRQTTITAGQVITYRDDGRDAYGNPAGDLTSSTTFTITDGTCTTNTCTTTTAGPHTVTGTISLREHLVTGTATVQVQGEIAPGGPGTSPPPPSPSRDSSPPSPAPSSSSSTGSPPPAPPSGSSLPPPAPPSSGPGLPPPSPPGSPATSPKCRPAARQLHGLRVAPRAAPPGTPVRITARLNRNFAGCPLAVMLGGSHVGDTTIGPDGSVSDRSAVPDAAKTGATTLSLVRTDGGVLATTAFEVVPKPPPTPRLLQPLLALLVAGGALLLSALGGKAVASQRARRQRRWVGKRMRVEPEPSPGHISAALDPHAPPPLTVRLDPQDHAGAIGISKETVR